MTVTENESKPHVLYLDDEQNNLNAFKAAFRRDFKVFIANTPKEALTQLEVNPEIKVVIADQRMPEMTGVEFFEKLCNIYPNKIRILLTGYSDIAAVIDSINKGQVYRFIDKPWNQDMIRNAIINATEIFDTRKHLQDKNIALQEAYNQLDKFVYSVSHDLRAPLMSILGLTNLAELEIKDEKSLEYFQSIQGMVGKLDGFIHQIIDHYKIMNSSDSIEKIAMQLVVKEVIDSIKYHPEAYGVKFEVNIQEDTDLTANKLWVTSVLNNLISNAFKFQRKEEINKYVKVSGVVNEEGAQISIADNGIGIEHEMVNGIFNMFIRPNRTHDGSGLGLYIVKDAIEKLGGSIELNPQVKVGTEIIFKIPQLNYGK